MFAGLYAPACGQTAPQPKGRRAPGLAQCAGSGRTGLWQKRQAGEGRAQHVIMDLRADLGPSDGELWRKIGRGSAAQAVAAARKSVIVPMLVIGCSRSGLVHVLFRAGSGVSATQMQRSMGVAADESERQHQDKASEKQRSHQARRPRSSRNSEWLHSTELGHMRGMPESGSGSVRFSCSACANQLDEIIHNVAAFVDLQSGRWNMQLGLAVEARSIGERYPGFPDP